MHFLRLISMIVVMCVCVRARVCVRRILDEVIERDVATVMIPLVQTATEKPFERFDELAKKLSKEVQRHRAK